MKSWISFALAIEIEKSQLLTIMTALHDHILFSLSIGTTHAPEKPIEINSALSILQGVKK